MDTIGLAKTALRGCILRIVEIFKGNRKEEMYLYVDQKEGLRQVPEDLLSTFGQTESVNAAITPLPRKALNAVYISRILAAAFTGS